MNKELVPYELALKLKEKGFNEDCLFHYQNDKLISEDEFCYHIKNGSVLFINWNDKGYQNTSVNWDGEKVIPTAAPMYQQVQEWLRDQRALNVWIDCSKDRVWIWTINFIENGDYIQSDDDGYEKYFKSHNEALIDGITEALNLIK
jgi:hypothetical protein